MCIAIPGKVISVSDNYAKVDFSGNVVNVNIGVVSAVPGDFVLVHAGCAIEVLSADLAQELLDIFIELDNLG
jgi:hydrogenase expression/formation protein HypC